jgi:hypothetical protein
VSGAALRLGRLRTGQAPGTACLLRAANVAGRVAALAVLGFFTFTGPRLGTADAAVQISAFTIGAVVVAWYSVAEGRAGSRRRDVLLMSYGLGAVAVTCGAASMTPRGGPLIFLACFAVLWAGAGMSPAGGWSVAVLGVAGVWSAWLASGTGTWITAVYQAAIPLGGLLAGRNVRAHRVQASVSSYLCKPGDTVAFPLYYCR